jgi:hypothetical protein
VAAAQLQELIDLGYGRVNESKIVAIARRHKR